MDIQFKDKLLNIPKDPKELTLKLKRVEGFLQAHLKCHYGFSKTEFSRKFDQWRARRKKNSDSDLSLASNSLLKSGTFGSLPRKQKPENE